MTRPFEDPPKIIQLLDAGWEVKLFKNHLGTYTARGRPTNPESLARLRKRTTLRCRDKKTGEWFDHPGVTPEMIKYLFGTRSKYLYTDDFTPLAALTRLAYKAHGEVV